MKIRTFFKIFLLITTVHLKTLAKENPISLETKTGTIKGSIVIPDSKTPMPIALIIAGSGPTDRDGNNPMLKNNCLKMLAEELSKNNIPSVRYDKRGIAESKDAGLDENKLRFENYVNDAVEWVNLLKQDKRFSKVIIIGHSEGSLIGMIAANEAKADMYISVAGAGQSADKILREQLKVQPKEVTELTNSIIDSLLIGKTVEKIDASLNGLFRPSVQPYLISWFKLDPQKEIKKLKIPILILQGNKDMQVKTSDAMNLYKANPSAQFLIINGMNHVMKDGSKDNSGGLAGYKDPNLPLVTDFVKAIADFILEQ